MKKLPSAWEIEAMKEKSLEHGKKVANCKCAESFRLHDRMCDWCRYENIKDFNFIQNILDMERGR